MCRIFGKESGVRKMECVTKERFERHLKSDKEYINKTVGRYWTMTQRLVTEEKTNMMATLRKRGIAIAILTIVLHLVVGIHIRLLLARNSKKSQQ